MTDDLMLTVPADIYEQCERNVEGTTFESVDEYVHFIISEVVTHEETATEADGTTGSEATAEQLEALGYLER